MSSASHRTVLLPGMDGSGRLFDPLQQHIDGAVHAISYEPDAPTAYDELVPWILAQLPTEPFVLVAESYSTPAAIQIAAQQPAGLKAVVLCNGFTHLRHAWVRRLVPWRLVFGLAMPRWAIRRWLVGPNASTALCDTVKQAVRATPPRRLAQRLRAALTCDVRTLLGDLSVPLLCLKSTQDRLVRPGIDQEAAPSMALRTLAGPHLLLQTHPQECWREIAEFVGRVASR